MAHRRSLKSVPSPGRSPAMAAVHPDSAGIDFHSEFHCVAVPADRDPQPVRKFGAFTDDWHALADWLLAAAFRPDDWMSGDQTCVLRADLRQRGLLVEFAAEHIRHLQKALTQMNLKLEKVLSDITGVTGLSINNAILAGERDPVKLARLRHENWAWFNLRWLWVAGVVPCPLFPGFAGERVRVRGLLRGCYPI